MRVPPDQSSTASDARVEREVGIAHAELAREPRQARAEGERPPRAGGSPPPRAGTAAARARRAPSSPTRRRRARACAASAAGSRQRRSSGSPPQRSDARSVRCRSGRTPRRRAARRRRERRVGPWRASCATTARTCARSSSVYCGEVLVDAAARCRSTRPGAPRWARDRATARRPGSRDARQRQLDAGRHLERRRVAPGVGPGEDLREGRVEDREVLAARAHDRAQPEVGVARARRPRRPARAPPPRPRPSRPAPRPRASRAPGRRPQAPSRTPVWRTRSRSSRTLSATPSVSSSVPSGPSAPSACAHAIVSPTPGSL